MDWTYINADFSLSLFGQAGRNFSAEIDALLNTTRATAPQIRREVVSYVFDKS